MVLIKTQSGAGPVFSQPKVGPVQFRSAKSGPGLVFAQPKVDPVRVELSETKVSTIV